MKRRLPSKSSDSVLRVAPAGVLILAGLVGYAVAMPALTLWGATFDAHTLLFSSMFIMCGFQAVLFAVFTKMFAIHEGLVPPDSRFSTFFRLERLETGILLGLAAIAVGCGLLGSAILEWRSASFGRLDYPQTMRLVVPGATLTALGFQTLLASFFVGILSMGRK